MLKNVFPCESFCVLLLKSLEARFTFITTSSLLSIGVVLSRKTFTSSVNLEVCFCFWELISWESKKPIESLTISKFCEGINSKFYSLILLKIKYTNSFDWCLQ